MGGCSNVPQAFPECQSPSQRVKQSAESDRHCPHRDLIIRSESHISQDPAYMAEENQETVSSSFFPNDQFVKNYIILEDDLIILAFKTKESFFLILSFLLIVTSIRMQVPVTWEIVKEVLWAWNYWLINRPLLYFVRYILFYSLLLFLCPDPCYSIFLLISLLSLSLFFDRHTYVYIHITGLFREVKNQGVWQ